MFKQIQLYLYIGIATFILLVVSYVGYVFYDRAEAKETIIKKDAVIEAKKIEVKTTSIAQKARGKIEQINKEEAREADTTFGVHNYSF